MGTDGLNYSNMKRAYLSKYVYKRLKENMYLLTTDYRRAFMSP